MSGFEDRYVREAECAMDDKEEQVALLEQAYDGEHERAVFATVRAIIDRDRTMLRIHRPLPVQRGKEAGCAWCSGGRSKWVAWPCPEVVRIHALWMSDITPSGKMESEVGPTDPANREEHQ